jgi:hypothetical protein
MSRTCWLSTWVQEFSATTGRLRGVARDEVLEEAEGLEKWAIRDDGDSHWRFERHGASEVWRILDALAHTELAVEGGVRWLHAFDYKDSDAWSELGPMVGVPDAELMAELPRLGEVARARGATFEVHDFVDLCNLRSRNGMHLFDVDTHGDSYLFVALPPAAYAVAIERGLLAPAPVFERTLLVGASPDPTALRKPSAPIPLGIALVGIFAVAAVVYTVVALARSGTPIGAVVLVVALIVGFEFGKSALLRRLDAAYGERFPRFIRALRWITRT